MVTNQTKNSGWKSDVALVKKHLKINEIYTVDRTEVDDFSSTVVLQEFPNIHFNTLSFEDVSTQSQEEDKKHPYIAKLNRE